MYFDRINLPDPTGEALQNFHIAKIELVILHVLDDLVGQKKIQFVVLKRNSMDNCFFDEESQTYGGGTRAIYVNYVK